MKINIRQIIKSKNYKLYQKIPSFVFSFFERVIHQDEFNTMIESISHLRGAKFASGVLNYLNIKREVTEKTPINTYCNRRIIFAANHPLGGIDGLAIAEHIHSKFGDVRVVVNDILMNIEQLNDIFIPINKHGRQKSSSVIELNTVLESNIPILYFPAGLCSRKVDGKITDLPWKNNFIKKAIEFERDIVPIKVETLNSPLFYNFAWARKKIGIKANIDMILLPSEVFKKRDKDISLIFGYIHDIKELKNSTNNTINLTNVIRESCYALQK